MTTQNTCPCGSANTYENCCGLLHQGKDTAKTAEQLMRSRYSAWSMSLIDYLHDTTWSKQQAGLSHAEMTEWAQRTQWLSLEILDTMAGQAGDDSGEVEFLARFQLPPVEAVQEHRERSKFVFENNQWFFIDPSIPVRSHNVGRNDPCTCGSGKKYKKCCG